MSNQTPNAVASSSKLSNNKSHLQYNSKQYDRIRVLGKGSFGTAVVHRRRTDCSLVVLKEIDLQRFKGDQEKELAINEARIMSTLNHTNIINYHNAYTTDTKLIIEMEYARQGTLANYLSFQVQPLEEQEILVIFRQICAGLDYLHSLNIIHLDLKMANLFVTIEGQVKIGDFGIAQYMRPQSDFGGDSVNQLPASGCQTNQQPASGRHKKMPPPSGSHLLGTLAYSSPERCLGQQTDFKSDIWSLGCILYELITAQALFRGESLPELVLNITRINYEPINRNMSPALIELFEQMIIREPDGRPSAKQLLAATGQMLSRIQLNWQKLHTVRTSRQRAGGGQRRFDLSTEVALFAAHNHAKDTGQINYLHSLVYQVRLDGRHVRLDRVNLPQMKRIKEICKGKSHYLVLTYDSIVYGWGDKSHGQLGACSLAAGSPATSARSRAFSSNSRGADLLTPKSTPSAASSTQTIVANEQQQQQTTGKQTVFGLLQDSPASARPFIINELNHRKIIQVAAGDNFSVFLNKTGIVMTCGDGSTGCLGRGSLQSCFTPCMVESLLNSDVVSISSGPEHVVAVCGNGRAFAWGNNQHGRLGIGVPASHNEKFVLRPRPVQFRSVNEVFVKSVFCGDRCTVFIDLDGKCWACGENRSNKLGLDMRRRFKKTVIVDQSWQPVEIGPLLKYRIVGCSMGKNHSSFMTNEGKLIVIGQDIDHTYRLQSNIMRARESHRRISSELKGRPMKLSPPPLLEASSRKAPNWTATECKRLAKSSIYNNQLAGYKTKMMDEDSENEHLVSGSMENTVKYPRYKLSRAQIQQIDSYVRKSRAYRKMPFECVISVCCTSKFTLALTSDNRVYFWGTRSHRKDDDTSHLPYCGSCSRRLAKAATEPQLISNQSSSDECFIKTGTTNESLMSSIQALGSDQPIIHAQDPRLTAKSPADLWILDYKPSETTTSDSDSESSLISNDNPSLSTRNSSFDSCCGDCCCDGRCVDDDLCLRHDAILEPQPMVSLYVPSMYNHNGCSLHLADLFCYDEDRFYLVLDTTIKLQQVGPSLSRGPSRQWNNHFSDQKYYNAAPATDETTHDKHPSGDHQPTEEQKNEINQGLSAPTKSQMIERASKESLVTSERELENDQNLNDREHNDEDDINNNNIQQQRTSTSQGGVSLEEPRSLSTFGGPSLGGNAQIIMGPSMRTMDREEALRPLSFEAGRYNQQTIADEQSASNSDGQIECPIALDIQQVDDEPALVHDEVRESSGGCPLLSAMRRSINIGELSGGTKRQRLNKSESTTNCMSNDIDETSSMPSWVRNEFIQHQSQQQQIFLNQANDSSNSRLEQDQINSIADDRNFDTPRLSMRFDNNEQERWTSQTKSKSSSSDGSEVTLNSANVEQRKTSLMLSNKQQFISRSQPDISEMDIRIDGPCEAIGRRASVLDEDTKPPIQASNLLDCNIYKRDANYQAGQNQSSLLTSAPSTRANSHSPLIKPDASPQMSRVRQESRRAEFSDDSRSTSCEEINTNHLKVEERARSVSRLEQCTNNSIDIRLSPASRNLEISSERSNQTIQIRPIDKSSLHHMQMNARGFKIYRSMAQLDPKTSLNGGKSASSASLASQLRKSFVKLFC